MYVSFCVMISAYYNFHFIVAKMKVGHMTSSARMLLITQNNNDTIKYNKDMLMRSESKKQTR